MRKSVLGQISTWAVLPVLTAMPAAAQEQQTQDAQEAAPLIYSQSGGLMLLTLPDLPSGVVDNGNPTAGTGNETIVGMMVGMDLGKKLGKFAGFDVIGNLSFFIGTGERNTTTTSVVSGSGTVQIASNTQSTAAITLATDPNATSASSQVTLSLPGGGVTQTQSATTIPGGGAQTAFAVALTSDNTGAVFSGVSTDGTNSQAFAFGGAADPSGLTIVGTGDLSGLRITQQSLRSVVYMGADASVGLSPPSMDSTSYTPYLSVGYRMLNQEISSLTSFDLPAPSGTNGFPLLGLQRYEHLDTNYLGGGVGLSVSHTLDNNITFTGSAEAGLRGFDAKYSGRDLALFPINNAGLELQRFDVGRATAEEKGVAWYAKGEAGLNFPLAPNLLLGFTGSVEYLSKVPTLERSAPVVQVSESGGSFNATYPSGAGQQSTSISFVDSWNFGLKATLSGAF